MLRLCDLEGSRTIQTRGLEQPGASRAVQNVVGVAHLLP